MSENRASRIAGTGARLLAGAVVAAVAVGATIAGVVFPWPGYAAAPVAVTVAPAPADTVLTCSGPLLALGRDSTDAGTVGVAADDDITVGASGAAPERDRLKTAGVGGSAGATRFTAPPEGRVRAHAAAAESASVEAEDLAGFAASACAPALSESWLVGGATTTGSADLVLLANPGDVAATVDLTLYGAQGRSIPPGGAGVVVPAGSQRVLPLAGLALGEEAPVVRVTATGAPVQAALQSSITRTLVPGGVDQEGVIATSARSVVIPGVRVTAKPGADPTTVLRVLAPNAATTATATVADASGRVVSTRQVQLPAGAPAEIAIDGLDPAVYSVTVTADAPVVAAVWQATGTGAGSDFAWFTAAPRLTGATLVAVPRGPSPRLSLVNTGTSAATVSVEPIDGGAARQVEVAAGATSTVAVARDTVYRLDPGGAAVAASVSFAGSGALAAFAAWPEDAVAAPLVVYP